MAAVRAREAAVARVVVALLDVVAGDYSPATASNRANLLKSVFTAVAATEGSPLATDTVVSAANGGLNAPALAATILNGAAATVARPRRPSPPPNPPPSPAAGAAVVRGAGGAPPLPSEKPPGADPPGGSAAGIAGGRVAAAAEGEGAADGGAADDDGGGAWSRVAGRRRRTRRQAAAAAAETTVAAALPRGFAAPAVAPEPAAALAPDAARGVTAAATLARVGRQGDGVDSGGAGPTTRAERVTAAVAELERVGGGEPKLVTVLVEGIPRAVRAYQLRTLVADLAGVDRRGVADVDRFGTTAAVTLRAGALPAFSAGLRGAPAVAGTHLRVLEGADPLAPSLLGPRRRAGLRDKAAAVWAAQMAQLRAAKKLTQLDLRAAMPAALRKALRAHVLQQSAAAAAAVAASTDAPARAGVAAPGAVAAALVAGPAPGGAAGEAGQQTAPADVCGPKDACPTASAGAGEGCEPRGDAAASRAGAGPALAPPVAPDPRGGAALGDGGAAMVIEHPTPLAPHRPNGSAAAGADVPAAAAVPNPADRQGAADSARPAGEQAIRVAGAISTSDILAGEQDADDAGAAAALTTTAPATMEIRANPSGDGDAQSVGRQAGGAMSTATRLGNSRGAAQAGRAVARAAGAAAPSPAAGGPGSARPLVQSPSPATEAAAANDVDKVTGPPKDNTAAGTVGLAKVSTPPIAVGRVDNFARATSPPSTTKVLRGGGVTPACTPSEQDILEEEDVEMEGVTPALPASPSVVNAPTASHEAATAATRAEAAPPTARPGRTRTVAGVRAPNFKAGAPRARALRLAQALAADTKGAAAALAPQMGGGAPAAAQTTTLPASLTAAAEATTAPPPTPSSDGTATHDSDAGRHD